MKSPAAGCAGFWPASMAGTATVPTARPAKPQKVQRKSCSFWIKRICFAYSFAHLWPLPMMQKGKRLSKRRVFNRISRKKSSGKATGKVSISAAFSQSALLHTDTVYPPACRLVSRERKWRLLIFAHPRTIRVSAERSLSNV